MNKKKEYSVLAWASLVLSVPPLTAEGNSAPVLTRIGKFLCTGEFCNKKPLCLNLFNLTHSTKNYKQKQKSPAHIKTQKF